MQNFTPQLHNDKELLRKLLKRYRNDALHSKGLFHGLQKDLIQNCVGGRLSPGFTRWKVVFELIKIAGNYALSVTDEGTTGLMGGMYKNQEVGRISERGELDEKHGLSRFIHQNFSGVNTGPGSEGQGKGLFHLLSEDYNVVFDSLRDEGKENESYVAGQKIMKGNVLENNLCWPETGVVPNREENEKHFMSLTNNQIAPLSTQGTRVIIMNIGINDVVRDVYEDEVNKEGFVENGGASFIEVFRNSFNPKLVDPNCIFSLKNMIIETWWEILRNYDAEIIIKDGDTKEEVRVSYSGSVVEKIVDAKDGQDISVLHKKNLTGSQRIYFQENSRGEKYYIKEMKFIHFKNGRPGLEPGVFLQRKGMKIGEIFRKNEISGPLETKFYGYVLLEKNAEEIIKKAENEVHYGFNFNVGVSKKLRKTIKDDLDPFFDRFIRRNRGDSTNSRMMENYRAITSVLSQLGSFNNYGSHKRSKISVSWLEIGLPNNNKSITFIDEIGPVKIGVNNGELAQFNGKATLSLYSTGVNGVDEVLQSEEVEVGSGSNISVVFNSFKVPTTFQNGLVFLKALISSGGVKKAEKTLGLWLNSPVPNPPKDKLINIQVHSPLFPNLNSARVDIGQTIKQLGFDFSSNLSQSISTNIKVNLEHRNEHGSWVSFHNIYDKNHVIDPFVDYSVSLEDLVLSDEVFGFFENKERTIDKRKVRVFIAVLSGDLLPSLSINRGQKLASSNRLQFNVGVDSAGNSPFKNVYAYDGMPYEKSRFTGNNNSGYNCEINQLFHEYKEIMRIDDSNDLKEEIKDDYETKEMIRQAVLLCLDSQNFEGPLFKEASAEYGDGNGRTYSEIFQDTEFLTDAKKAYSVTEELINRLTSQC